jgi:hypothetical protein
VERDVGDVQAADTSPLDLKNVKDITTIDPALLSAEPN